MAGNDIEDKKLTSDEPQDAKHWTEENTNAANAAADAYKTQQQADEQNNKKNRQTERSRAFKDAQTKQFKQKLKKKAVKEGKKAFKKIAEQAAKKGADQANAALVTGATGGAGAPIAEPAGQVMTKAEEMTVKAGVEGIKDVLNPSRILEYPEKIDKKIKTGARWIGYITLGIIIILLIVMMLVSGAAGALQQEEEEYIQSNPINVSKSGPSELANPPAGETNTITYQISASYNGTAEDIMINDELPAGVDFVSATGKYNLIRDGIKVRTITWSARENGLTTVEGPTTFGTFTVSLTVRTALKDIYLVNIAYASITNANGTPNVNITTDYVAPTFNDCGKYAQSMARNYLLGSNYGDPVCDFSREALRDLLIKEENNNMTFVNYWYVDIIPYESGFNPNAWAAPVGQQAQLDACGAWGLYQMGSSYRVQPNGTRYCDPGQPPPAPGKNGQYDRNDVNWQVQTTNAITYNRNLGCTFWYWSTYRRRHPQTKQC